MRRQLFTAASLLSLLLFIATVALWVGRWATGNSWDRTVFTISGLRVSWDGSLNFEQFTPYIPSQFFSEPDNVFPSAQMNAWDAARATKISRFMGFEWE